MSKVVVIHFSGRKATHSVEVPNGLRSDEAASFFSELMNPSDGSNPRMPPLDRLSIKNTKFPAFTLDGIKIGKNDVEALRNVLTALVAKETPAAADLQGDIPPAETAKVKVKGKAKPLSETLAEDIAAPASVDTQKFTLPAATDRINGTVIVGSKSSEPTVISTTRSSTVTKFLQLVRAAVPKPGAGIEVDLAAGGIHIRNIKHLKAAMDAYAPPPPVYPKGTTADDFSLPAMRRAAKQDRLVTADAIEDLQRLLSVSLNELERTRRAVKAQAAEVAELIVSNAAAALG